jgi:hypothetical protein
MKKKLWSRRGLVVKAFDSWPKVVGSNPITGQVYFVPLENLKALNTNCLGVLERWWETKIPPGSSAYAIIMIARASTSTWQDN